MRISARTDYGVRAALELAAAHPAVVKGEALSLAQDIPLKFMENILLELRRSGLVGSRRGTDGGYWLAVEPESLTVADVVRAVSGSLAEVRGEPPDADAYPGAARALGALWTAAAEATRVVLESVTLADVVAGRGLPTPRPAATTPG